MKNLGGILIDFTEENGKYNAAIGLNVNGVLGKVIATALVSIAARFARNNPRIIGLLIDELGELVGLEDETEDELGIAEQ